MATVDVKVTNKSGKTVELRLDEDSDALARIRKRVQADKLADVKVSKVSGARRGGRRPAIDVDETGGEET